MAFVSSPEALTWGNEDLCPIWLNVFLFNDTQKGIYGNFRGFNDFCQEKALRGG
jgi:hypothetical protein